MKKLWFKIGISFFILFFITMGLVGLFSGELMKTTYLDMKENQLEDEARVLLHTTNIENVNLDQNSAQIQEQLSPLTEEVDARITIVDNKGHVIADSKEDPTMLENHANRPEFKEVLQDGQEVGIATRKK